MGTPIFDETNPLTLCATKKGALKRTQPKPTLGRKQHTVTSAQSGVWIQGRHW